MARLPAIMESKETLAALAEYQADAIVSRTVLKGAGGSVTLFAFDRGQELSEHSTPHDAFVLLLEGNAEIRLAGVAHQLGGGESIRLPAGVPHAVAAPDRFKMLLVMIRSAPAAPE